jgi:hypothetical protein
MARKCFYSFHYKPDNWRASKIRNIGVIEGNQTVSDHDWEKITNGGDAAIEKWIADQMSGKSCNIVLIGANTAGRKWINYEIVKTWNDKKGILGIYIHNITDSGGAQSAKENNPFQPITVGQRSMADIVKTYDPPYAQSDSVYGYISKNIESWVDEAIAIRQKN